MSCIVSVNACAKASNVVVNVGSGNTITTDGSTVTYYITNESSVNGVIDSDGERITSGFLRLPVSVTLPANYGYYGSLIFRLRFRIYLPDTFIGNVVVGSPVAYISGSNSDGIFTNADITSDVSGYYNGGTGDSGNLFLTQYVNLNIDFNQFYTYQRNVEFTAYVDLPYSVSYEDSEYLYDSLSPFGVSYVDGAYMKDSITLASTSEESAQMEAIVSSVTSINEGIERLESLSETIGDSVKDVNSSVQDVGDSVKEQTEEQKGFFASVLQWFSNFPDMLLGIVVPDESAFDDFMSRMKEFLDNHLGFLMFPIGFLLRLTDILLDNSGTPTLTFPAFSIMGYQVWDDYDFDLRVVEDSFPFVFDALRFATSALILSAVVNLCYKKLNTFLGGESD